LFADVAPQESGLKEVALEESSDIRSPLHAPAAGADMDSEDLFVSAIDDPGLSTIKLDDGASSDVPAANASESSSVPVAAAAPTKRVVNVKPEKKQPVDTSVLDIRVTEPEKIGAGMSAFVVYRVLTTTNLSYFRGTELLVKRRFSDFLGLYEKLLAKYSTQCRILPQPPAKNLASMLKMKNAKEAPGEDDFVECRRAELERFLNRLGAHTVLRMDPDLREFLELEGDLPRATSTQALSGAGVKRLFKGIGDSVSKIATGYVEESDSWFETKAEEVARLEEQLRRLHTSAETLAEYRRDVSGSMRELSRASALLAASEENSALARAVSQLSETQEKLERAHLRQANSDFYLLAELFKDYLGLVQSTKDAFHTRIKLFRAWQEAQATLAKKRELKVKLELAGKTEKLGAADAEIRDAMQRVEAGEEEFGRVSKTLKTEVEQLDAMRVADLKTNLTAALEAMLAHQEDILQAWETFLPEAKAIS